MALDGCNGLRAEGARSRRSPPRVELVWPGKHEPDELDAELTPSLRVVERVGEHRARRGGPPPGGWPNRLIAGDNLLVLRALRAELAGAVELIYIDPPFATGATFSMRAPRGDARGPRAGARGAVAYRDASDDGVSGYLGGLARRLELARELLSPTGSILIHCDARLSHYLGVICDELFGVGDRGARPNQPGFRNEIVWMYGLGGSGARSYPKKHDVILWYTKGGRWYFEPPRVPATSQRMRGMDKKAPDTWDIPAINNMARERTGYPTQKPERLLERIISAHSAPGALVLDFFCGSGTTLAVAERLGRRWLGCDVGRPAILATRKRLLELRAAGVEGARPFDLLDLGSTERRRWQRARFDGGADGASAAAYRRLIVERYEAEPVAGSRIHGRRGAALVRVEAVDAPVTLANLEAALDETRARGARELHVLAWEWALGLADSLTERARARRGVKLRLVTIPREVMDPRALAAGDVRFFEVARLRVEVVCAERPARGVRLVLADFSNTLMDEARPRSQRARRGWPERVDSWAVDWDYRGDPFVARWGAHRSLGANALPLETPLHVYERGGAHQIAVKAADTLGNEASALVSWSAP